MKNNEYFKTALDLYWNEDYEKLFEYCKEVCPKEIDNIELWKLFGVGAGMTGKPSIALMCYETVFNLEPDDDYNLINYLRALFHNDQVEIAIDKIYEYESRFNNQHIINNFKEILTQAQGQYDIKQVVECLPNSLRNEVTFSLII